MLQVLSNPISLEPLFTMLQPSCTMANCVVTKLSYDNLITNNTKTLNQECSGQRLACLVY